MLDKTKAAMPGRQCSTENKEQKQDTRPASGGQRMSQRNFAPSDFIQFCTLGTAASAQLGCTALQHTQYFPQWGECEPVAGTLILRTSFRVAQMQLGTSPQLWGNLDAWYHPFGSMPRDCSSFRKTRFIQVAREESPSFFISASSCARNSCWRRIWYWSVLVLVLDIVITKSILSAGGCNYNVTKMVLQLLNMTKPCSARTLTGPLTNR